MNIPLSDFKNHNFCCSEQIWPNYTSITIFPIFFKLTYIFFNSKKEDFKIPTDLSLGPSTLRTICLLLNETQTFWGKIPLSDMLKDSNLKRRKQILVIITCLPNKNIFYVYFFFFPGIVTLGVRNISSGCFTPASLKLFLLFLQKTDEEELK